MRKVYQKTLTFAK